MIEPLIITTPPPFINDALEFPNIIKEINRKDVVTIPTKNSKLQMNRAIDVNLNDFKTMINQDPDSITVDEEEYFKNSMSGMLFTNLYVPIHAINIENIATKLNEIINKINEIEIWKAKGRKATSERQAAKKTNAKGTRTKAKKPANTSS